MTHYAQSHENTFCKFPVSGVLFHSVAPRGTLTYPYSRSKVEKLLDEGCTGIADLRSRKFRHLITPSQRVYAKYFEHIEKPTTREEAETVLVSRVQGDSS